LYRYTRLDDYFHKNYGPMHLWHLNRDTSQLELVTTVTSAFDAGTSYYPLPSMSARSVWGGSELLISDRLFQFQPLGYPEGRVLLATDLSELSSPREVEGRFGVLTDGIDGDTRLLWVELGNGQTQQLLRFVGGQVTTTTIDALCGAPFVQTSTPITMACLSDAGLDVWVADRDGARAIAHNEVPAEREGKELPFLAQVNPLKLLYLKMTDAGSTFVNTCTSSECHELFEVFTSAPNAGVDDAGALFIADYIRDAGVRVTRFAPTHW